MDIVSESGFRSDGRKCHELRRIRCKLGVYQQADGSAYLEQGSTKVLAAVYGPHEVRKNRSKMLHDKAIVNCQYSMATFSTQERKFRPRGDRKSTEMTAHLQKTFNASILTSLYPRSQIDIYCEILQADGGNLAACINAATLALIDAGVPMKDYVAAATGGTMARDTQRPIVDASAVEEGASDGPQMTVAILPRSEEIVLLEQTGRCHMDDLERLIDSTVKGCKDVATVLDGAVRKRMSGLSTALGWE